MTVWVASAMDRTDYRYNLEYRAQIQATMAATAAKLLNGENSVIEAARELSAFVDVAWAEPILWEPMRGFVGINSEMDALPVGDVRALWDAKSLEKEDQKIAVAEQRWGAEAREAAQLLLSLLQQNG